MKTSIIIPCFNNAGTISLAVESALNQHDVEKEVIVVDDGSTDGSRDILKSYNDRIKIVLQKNHGACAARNTGLRKSSGKYVKFLDADDKLHPECLKMQVQQADEQDEDVIVFGRASWVDENGKVIGSFPSYSMDDGLIMNLVAIIDHSPLTSCPLHRRKLLDTVGGFNEVCPRGQEHDLHVRLALNGAHFVFRDTFCYYYCQHSKIDRISAMQYHRSVCNDQVQVYQQQMEIAQEHNLLSPKGDISLAFARNWWRHGRLCLRAGHMDIAKICFYKSRQLTNGRVSGAIGSPVYILLNRIVGPIFAEKILRVFD